MNTLGYQDELGMDLMLDEAKEPDIDALREHHLETLKEVMDDYEEPIVIRAFISWLWKMGYNENIPVAIEKMILKGQDLKEKANIDPNDELTGEVISGG